MIALPDGVRHAAGAVPEAAPAARPVAATRIWAAVADDGRRRAPSRYLARHGQPIRYSYVPDTWPLSAYQTVFARSPGSAEMPSAARPFTAELVTRLITGGVRDRADHPAHRGGVAGGGRGAAAGVVRRCPQPTARPGQPDPRGRAPGDRGRHHLHPRPGERGGTARPRSRLYRPPGWTGLVLGPEHPARVVNGLITGWHDAGRVAPRAAGGRGRAGAGPARLPRGRGGGLPVARVRRQLPAAASAGGRPPSGPASGRTGRAQSAVAAGSQRLMQPSSSSVSTGLVT